MLDAVRRGQTLPIVWAPLDTRCNGHLGTIWVATDTLRFGAPGPNADPGNWDWVRLAVTADTAQRIADQLGVLMPTDRILDLAYAQADVRLTPHIQSPVTATTAAMLEHHRQIEAERAGREGLLSTVGKDWILGPELFPPRPGVPPAHPLGVDGAINYGWHVPTTPENLAAVAYHQGHPREPYGGPYMGQPGVILWQTKGFRHNRRHVDYSQWVPRFVHPQMLVDGRWERGRLVGGRWIPTAEVMMSPELWGLVSYEGPLRGTRYPLLAQLEANRSAAGGTDAEPGRSAESGGLVSYQGPLQSERLTHPPGKGPRGTDPSGNGQNRSVRRSAGNGADPFAEIDAGAPGNGTGAGLRVQAPQGPSGGVVVKVIDLGNHALRFENSFPDARFLGIPFPGLCGGMSSATLDYFFSGLPAPMTTTTPSTHDTLGAYIKARQVDSLAGWHLARFAAMIANPSDAWIAAQTAASFEELKQSIDAGKPVLLGLIPAPWSLDPSKVTNAHQVVGHGYAINDAGGTTVMILDPNRPLLKGNYLHQAPGTPYWIEPPLRGMAEKVWRGFFVASGYKPKLPPSDEKEPVAVNDAGDPLHKAATFEEREPGEAGASADMLGNGIATVAGAAGGSRVGKEAATGAAVGAAVGAVLEAVPVVGPVLHAVAIAAGAIGGAISGALRDTFHPTPLQAALALVLFHIAPGMLFSGIDKVDAGMSRAEWLAARLVRYFRLVAGIVKNGAPLYNPRDTGSRSNPYMESASRDPQEPLTDVRLTAHIKSLVIHHGNRPASPAIPPMVRTPADARGLLQALRGRLRESGLLDWQTVRANLPGLRVAVARVRALAGETGPDPVLAAMLGGDVTPLPAPARARSQHHRASHLAAPPPALPVRPQHHPVRRGGPMHDPTDPFNALLETSPPVPERITRDNGDPFAEIDAGAPIGVAPETALEQLLVQLDRRFPFRGKGPLDGITTNVLRITEDRSINGALRNGPDFEALKRVVQADGRAGRVNVIADRYGTRYLAITVQPSQVANSAVWDLGGLNRAQSESDTGDVLDDVRETLARSRKAQRDYLRGTWVSDTLVGRFLNLDKPDEPAPRAPPPAASKPSRGWATPSHITLVPEASGADGTDTEDAGYPALPSLAALRKLEEQLDAAWPARTRWNGGNISDASIEQGRGVLEVPESPPPLGPGLADLRAAVQRDGRVVETEIVTSSFWGSQGLKVPTLRIWTAEAGTNAHPWNLSPPLADPGWELYRRRPGALGVNTLARGGEWRVATGDPFADLNRAED